jgi:hypothetical protein
MNKYQIFLSKAASKVLARLRKADMLVRNGGRAMVWVLRLGLIPLAVRARASDVKSMLHFSRFCYRHGKSSGVKHLVLYLKASQVLLQQSIGGQRLADTRPLKVTVGRSRSGIPLLIPRADRVKIRSLDARCIKMWMTFLGLYRVLGFPGKVSFDTITRPGKIISGDNIVGFQRFVHDHF